MDYFTTNTKHLLTVLLLTLMVPMGMTAQKSKDKDQKRLEEKARMFESDEAYITGRGQSERSLDDARTHAMAEILSQISTRVTSSLKMNAEEKHDGQDMTSQQTINMETESYTSGILDGAKTIVLRDARPYSVFAYIDRDALDQMFKNRERQVDQFNRESFQALEKGNVGDALRYKYWAWVLLRTLPTKQRNEMTTTIQGERRTLESIIPSEMRDIFGKLKVDLSNDAEGNVNMVATYDGGKVTGLSVCYDVGTGLSDLQNFNGDGLASLDLAGRDVKSLKLYYEYKFEDMAKAEPALRPFIPMFKDDRLPGDNVQLTLGSKKEQKEVQKVFQQTVAETSKIEHAVEVKDRSMYDRAIKGVLDAIAKKKHAEARKFFNGEGFPIYEKIIVNGNARLLGKADVQYYEAPRGRVIARSVPMTFRFGNNHVTFTEDVTFTFAPDGLIESLAYGLDKFTREQIFNGPSKWSDSLRMAVATFIENYKTAFALKDTAYIRGIFDEYATITTGRVITRSTRQGDQGPKLQEDVEYTRYTKEEYLNKLVQQFRQNKFINLHFSDLSIKKMARGDQIFGLRMAQDYYSSSYSDSGYLFLMVDMKNTSQPIIKVRTWQPNRDPQLTPRLKPDDPEYGLIYEGSFEY